MLRMREFVTLRALIDRLVAEFMCAHFRRTSPQIVIDTTNDNANRHARGNNEQNGGLSNKIKAAGRSALSETLAFFFRLPLLFGALVLESCAKGQSDQFGQYPHDIPYRPAPLFAIRPASVGVASCITGSNQSRATRHMPVQCIAGLNPCLLMEMLPDRRHEELSVPVGAAVMRNLVAKRLLAMYLLIEQRLQHAVWGHHLHGPKNIQSFRIVTSWSL